MSNAYRQAEKLGADRWMALLAAAELTGGDQVVIDAGSAITVDLLRADGRHLGGAILPGFNTSLETFSRKSLNTSISITRISPRRQAPGCSTEAAIQIDYDGNVFQYLPAFAEPLDCQAFLPDETGLLLAGGDAARVQQSLGGEPQHRPGPGVFAAFTRLAEPMKVFLRIAVDRQRRLWRVPVADAL